MDEPLYVIDTGMNYDRPVQKGQWAVSDITGKGAEIVNEWLKERTRALVDELKYAKLEGTGKIDVSKLSDHFDITIEVSVSIIPSTKKPKKTPVRDGAVKRKAAR